MSTIFIDTACFPGILRYAVLTGSGNFARDNNCQWIMGGNEAAGFYSNLLPGKNAVETRRFIPPSLIPQGPVILSVSEGSPMIW